MKLRFFRCNLCGKIIAMVKDTGMATVCCDQAMEEIVPNENDGSFDKHVPTYKISGNKLTVTIGKVLHPSETNHYIEWIAVQTNKGNQRVSLNPKDVPEVSFLLRDGEKVEAIYSYCNIHSLYMLDLTK